MAGALVRVRKPTNKVVESAVELFLVYLTPVWFIGRWAQPDSPPQPPQLYASVGLEATVIDGG